MASGSLSVVEHRLLDENVDMSPLITRINRDQIVSKSLSKAVYFAFTKVALVLS